MVISVAHLSHNGGMVDLSYGIPTKAEMWSLWQGKI